MEILDVKKEEILNVKVRTISSFFFSFFSMLEYLGPNFFCPMFIWLELGKRINEHVTIGEKVSQACFCSLSPLFTSLDLFFFPMWCPFLNPSSKKTIPDPSYTAFCWSSRECKPPTNISTFSSGCSANHLTRSSCGKKFSSSSLIPWTLLKLLSLKSDA